MAPLRLELRASRALAAAILALHAAAALSVLGVMGGLEGAGLSIGLMLVGALAARDRALLVGSRAVRALELGREGAFTAELANGVRIAGKAGARRHLGPWWVVVPLAGAPWAALVVKGMLAPEAYRRLRVWALWGRLPASAQAIGAG